MSCTLRDIQQTENNILKDFARVCSDNGIKYYLAQGTLLGAVRHKGFIPWDDDIDVILDYKELKKLLKIYPAEGFSGYSITNYTNEKHNPLSWAKIRADNTLSRPKRYKDIPINWGVCIDLFPICPVSNVPVIRKLEINFFKLARKMLMAEMTKYEENHSFAVRLLEKLPLWLRHFFLNLSFTMFSLHKDSSKYVFLLCKGGKVIKRSIVEGEDVCLEFEENFYPVPSDYHGYLTCMFGDYMTPPPLEEQGGHDLKMGDIEWKI